MADFQPAASSSSYTSASGAPASPSRSARFSSDLLRTRNFASSLSLRKDLEKSNGPESGELSNAGGGTFTKLRNLSQLRLFKEDSPQTLEISTAAKPTMPSTSSGDHASSKGTVPELKDSQPPSAYESTGNKLMKRRSRLLDAFRSKRPQSSFEVIRKPLANRTTVSAANTAGPSTSTSSSHLSQQLQQQHDDSLASLQPAHDGASRAAALASSPSSELSQRQRTLSETISPSGRSISGRESRTSFSSEIERDHPARWQDSGMQTRAAHPPSTTKTRRAAPGLGMPFGGRRQSSLGVDVAASNSSKAASPLPSPAADGSTGGGTFSLHSFRNVRSASDASKAEGAGSAQARRQSVLMGEEFITPTEELVLPSPFGDDGRSPGSKRSSVALSPSQNKVPSPARPSMAPFQGQNNTSSISVAKFRQAARSRSEVGAPPPVADEFGAPLAGPRMTFDDVHEGSRGPQAPQPAFLASPSTMSPSQELAALEAELSQGGRSTPLLRMLRERERSVSPAGVDVAAVGNGQNGSAVAAALSPPFEPAETGLAAAATFAPTSKGEDDAGFMARPRERGLFIVVEGLDRAGKSTQVARMAERLAAKEIKFPDRTTAIGQMINSYLAQTSNLDDKAIHLLFSANRWECVQSILTTLASGQSIVCDRYAFSGIAYSCAKGLSFDWCKAPDVGLPLPDLTIFLDLDAETAAARGGYGEERYEKREFQAKVRDAFRLVSAEVKDHGGRWATVNAAGTLDEVTREIHRVLLQSTASIDLRIGEVGRLFVGQPRAAAPRTAAPSTSSKWDDLVDSSKRRSIDGLGSLTNASLLRHFRSGSQNGTAPASQVGEVKATSPAPGPNYADQLAAMRTAAAGTLTGFFGSQGEAEKPSALGFEPNAASAAGPTSKGQGLDSERVLSSYKTSRTGRRMTLVEMIDQIEAGRSPESVTTALPPPTLPWVAAERPARERTSSQSSATVAPAPASAPALAAAAAAAPVAGHSRNEDSAMSSKAEQFPSTFALGNRSRRSLNVSDIAKHASPVAAPWADSESSDEDDDSDDAAVAAQRGLSRSAASTTATATVQAVQAAAEASAASRSVPLVTPSPQRAVSISQKTSTTVESAVSTPATEEPVTAPIGAEAETASGVAVAAAPSATTSPASVVRPPPKSPLRSPRDSLQPLPRPSADQSSRSSVSPVLRPASRPQSTSPPPPSRSPSSPHSYQPMPTGDLNALNSQQLAMLAAQHQQMEMQQQYQQHYMQHYMAAATMLQQQQQQQQQDPMLAQRAHLHAQAQAQAQYQYQYQMMLMQQQQHHFFAHGGSVYGGSEIGLPSTRSQQQPLAAFMQPRFGQGGHSSSMSDYGGATGGGAIQQGASSLSRRSAGQLHARTKSGSNGLAPLVDLNSNAGTGGTRSRNASPPSSPPQPMLSMMMAPPPPPSAIPSSSSFLMHPGIAPPFLPYGGGGVGGGSGFARPGLSSAQSEIGTSTAPRAPRISRMSTSGAAAGSSSLMGPPPLPSAAAKSGSSVANGRHH